jgi:hypothetical protein
MTDRIPREEAFVGEHLSDVAAVLVADGALELVPPEVNAHLHSCESCSARVAREVALSVRADAMMRAVGVRSTAPAHRFPAWLVMAALALAAVGFAPSARPTAHAAMDAIATAPSLFPVAIDSVLSLLRGFSGATFTITALASAAVLAILGFAIARQARAPQLT